MQTEKKILFIVAHRPGRSPGQRFRFEQYLSFLKKNNYTYDISYIINKKDDIVFYNKGNIVRKAFILLKSIYIRYRDYKKANDYDIIFIYRETLMIGSIFFEKLFKKTNTKLILDFDDAIWLQDVSEANYYLRWLKNPAKTSKIISLCDLIMVGNTYLSNYAKTYNSNTIVIPTTIDTAYYQPTKKSESKTTVTIGWTGSYTTIKHLETAIPFLKKLKELYTDKIDFLFITDNKPSFTDIQFEFKKWNASTEINDLNLIDIGIMPLPDDDWAKGKCGFKGLQYMALELPAILSPVGVNTDIITDGVNGFLASTHEEWITKLSQLIESKELREKFGKAGRQTVITNYSVESQKEKYLNSFNSLLKT